MKTGRNAGVRVFFSAPNKLSKLCRKVNNNDRSLGRCNVKHKCLYTECSLSVAYNVPLSCGKSYVGQTGRSVNDHLREHANSLKTFQGSNLATHCGKHGCLPELDHTSIVTTYPDQRTREIASAFTIYKMQDSCVSMPSISLHAKEISYLGDVAAEGDTSV